MTNLCTEECFLSDVENHSIKILKDDDVSRHISFTNGGSSVYRFDLITWPGHLCISGDFGTYVFRRIPDMFDFFRMDDDDFNKNPDKQLNINPGYWGEKLESISANGGYEEFDADVFKERVTNDFNMFWEDTDHKEAKAECWEAVKDDVLSKADDNECFAYSAVQDFHYKTPEGCNNFYFQDFFDSGGTESYTFRYIWCLYAIVYGINFYSELKAAKNSDSE